MHKTNGNTLPKLHVLLAVFGVKPFVIFKETARRTAEKEKNKTTIKFWFSYREILGAMSGTFRIDKHSILLIYIISIATR